MPLEKLFQVHLQMFSECSENVTVGLTLFTHYTHKVSKASGAEF